MGIADRATAAGTLGRLTMVVPASAPCTCHPAQASTAKKSSTAASAVQTARTRHAGRSRSTSVGTPMWPRARAASAAP